MSTGLRSINGNPASPPYTNGPYSWGERVSFPQGLAGTSVPVVNGSNIWYVDKNISTGVTGDGTSWDTPFLTLPEAVAAAGAYDIIYMGRGYYQEADTIEIVSTQRGLKIFGPTTGGVATSNGLSSATSGADILYINADDVEIAGITFWCLTNGKNGIDIGEDYDGYNNWIHDCCFITGVGGNTLGEYGIKVNNTDDCVGTLIENNYFSYMSTAAIVSYATRCTIRNNMIWSSSIGIDLSGHEAEGRANTAVYGNKICGRGTETSGDIGIKLAATEPTAGCLFIADNIVTNFSTNITTGKGDESIVNNGTYRDGSDFGQVDIT